MRVIRGKKALVTGAGSGIGRAIAVRLAREGADVCLVEIDEESLAEVADEVRRMGVEALPIPCDVSRPEQIDAAVDQLLERWGYVDLLVNNVGVVFTGTTHGMPAQEWDRLLAINLHAPIHFTRRLLPVLLERPDSHLVNVASMYGLFALRKSAAYHTTKFGLVGLSESLRAEYSPVGLGVSTICPGFVQTNLFRDGTTTNPSGVPRPPNWICTTPEHVADKTIRAIYRNRRLVLITPMAYFGFYLKRFAPWLLDWIQHWGHRKATRKRLRRIEKSQAAGRSVETAESKSE